MGNISGKDGVFISTLIRLLKKKKAPFMIIDTKKQSVIHTQNWTQDAVNPTEINGTLIITNDKYNGSYHTSTINCLEYISECTFSFIPMDSMQTAGVTYTGEYIRLYDINVQGVKRTIDIAGVPEKNERCGIIYAVISALITAGRTTNDMCEKNKIMNQLNAIPFAVCCTDLDGRILGYNYHFENLAFEGEIQPNSMEKLNIADIRLDMEKSRWEDKYIAKNLGVLGHMELLNTGQWHSVSKTFVLQPDSDELIGIAGIVEDISQQPLKNHGELRVDLIVGIFLKKLLAAGDKVAFIVECKDRLPVMYLSNNLDLIGLDAEKTIYKDFQLADYIIEEDRARVIEEFASEQGINTENYLTMSVEAADNEARLVEVAYTKTRYLYHNSIIAYGVITNAV